MTRLQDLLKPDFSIPQTDQLRAMLRLPELVRESCLNWWTKSPVLTIADSLILIFVAPWSQYDLAMLDLLDEEIAGRSIENRTRLIPVYVANLHDYETVEELTNDCPVITRTPLQTPMTVVREMGQWRQQACGKAARDLAATTLGIPPDEFNEQVIRRVPRYLPTAS